MSDTPRVPENKVKGDALLHNEWNAAAHASNIINNLTASNGLEIIKSGAGTSLGQTVSDRLGLPAWTMRGINLDNADIDAFQVVEVTGIPVSEFSNNRLFQDYRGIIVRSLTNDTIDKKLGLGGIWRSRAIAMEPIPGNGGTGRLYVGGLCLTTLIVPVVAAGETSLSSYDKESTFWVGPGKYATIDTENEIIENNISINLKFLTIANHGEFEVLWVEDTKLERRFAVIRFPGVKAFPVYKATADSVTANGVETVKLKQVISDGEVSDDDLDIEMVVLP